MRLVATLVVAAVPAQNVPTAPRLRRVGTLDHKKNRQGICLVSSDSMNQSSFVSLEDLFWACGVAHRPLVRELCRLKSDELTLGS